MTFGLRCSAPACRSHPASLPVRVPSVEGLPPASFGFASRLRLAVQLRLPSSAPIGSFHPIRFCPCWAHAAAASQAASGDWRFCCADVGQASACAGLLAPLRRPHRPPLEAEQRGQGPRAGRGPWPRAWPRACPTVLCVISNSLCASPPRQFLESSSRVRFGSRFAP